MPAASLIPLASAARLMAVAGAFSLALGAEPAPGTSGQKDAPAQAAASVDVHAIVLSVISTVIDQTIGATRIVPVEFANRDVPITFVGRQTQEAPIQPIYLHSIRVKRPPSTESITASEQEKKPWYLLIDVQIPDGVRSHETARIFQQGLAGLAAPMELSGVVGSKTLFNKVERAGVRTAEMTLRYSILKSEELLPFEQTVTMAGRVYSFSCSLAIMDQSRLHPERQGTLITPLSLVRTRPQPINLVIPAPLPVD